MGATTPGESREGADALLRGSRCAALALVLPLRRRSSSGGRPDDRSRRRGSLLLEPVERAVSRRRDGRPSRTPAARVLARPDLDRRARNAELLRRSDRTTAKRAGAGPAASRRPAPTASTARVHPTEMKGTITVTAAGGRRPRPRRRRGPPADRRHRDSSWRGTSEEARCADRSTSRDDGAEARGRAAGRQRPLRHGPGRDDASGSHRAQRAVSGHVAFAVPLKGVARRVLARGRQALPLTGHRHGHRPGRRRLQAHTHVS